MGNNQSISLQKQGIESKITDEEKSINRTRRSSIPDDDIFILLQTWSKLSMEKDERSL